MVALVGATASGKSAVALAAAERVGSVEVVSVDSMQVYRGMDIGTAKPAPAEQARVRHHLIDLVDPHEEFSLGEYQRAASTAVDEIRSRGRVPLLVGGTGLYLRAVTDGLVIPGTFPEIRAELENQRDLDVLVARLRELDPLAASRMEATNRRRVVRALEVTLGTGRPFSSFGPGLERYPDVPVRFVGIRRDRDDIRLRVRDRFARLMASGLLDEVRKLAARPAGLSRTATQALGYRELLDHLAGRCTLGEAVELAVMRTQQFAVRQERWFRRDPRIRWVDPGDASDTVEACLRAATE